MYFVDVHDVAVLHVAAVLDPEVRNARLQTWGHSSNWNDFLHVVRELRPQKEFIPDYTNSRLLSITTDQSEPVALLKKWADQDEWKPLKDSIAEGINNPFFKL